MLAVPTAFLGLAMWLSKRCIRLVDFYGLFYLMGFVIVLLAVNLCGLFDIDANMRFS